jgi:predicted RNase H-like HicB family nuclease
MEFVYPSVFSANDDGSYTITFPDLPGCISEGKSLPGAMQWAQWALSEWLEYLTDKKMEIPVASSIKDIIIEDENELVTLIYANLSDMPSKTRSA